MRKNCFAYYENEYGEEKCNALADEWGCDPYCTEKCRFFKTCEQEEMDFLKAKARVLLIRGETLCNQND